MRRELASVLDEVEADEAARVMILTGAGGNFCAGGDVKTMRARRHTAAEGRARVGLVNRVVPATELMATTRALAEKIAAGPPAVLKMAKHMVNRAATSDLAAALDLEAFSQGIAISSEDHQEGLAAFFEKRPAKFTGR